MSRFLLDVMCGGLTTYLRFCGHDTVYALDRGEEDDDRLRAIAAEEGRTLVTRDVHLANRADEAILLRRRDTEAQLAELLEAGVSLHPTEEPEYCGRCNGPVERVPPETTTPEYAPDDDTPTWRCLDCGQCFWRGSHWDRMRETLERVRAAQG
ncbi:Mut7-C RNAse domain-containing protein [Haloarchaeobius amylolyticus]|uniref:Mut7-C RNAse domain-containing protein n=1 Tax=Haloarchaeobius amylolyticus TaxID=1198296 RepID=UPI00226E6B5F|nr:Mut7-C RNAse domain-containing protein [Haloarchaeobius amylolyticus]